MRMNKDGLFKIMQITDMQEIPKVSPDTMALLDAAIEDEKPDLVVYTGDQIKGYGVSYKGKGKELENAVAKTINTLLEPVTKRNIPFAVTFGNHDRQVGISNKDQFNDIYKALPNCIGTQAEGIDGGGTYNIPIKASDGSDRDAFNLYLFDSGTDAKGGGYEAFDKKIISLVVEIIFMSFILVLTYIIWGKIDLSKYSTIASRYANNGEGLEVILKENESDVTLKVSNSDVKEKEYVLYLGVKDSYNLNKKDLKIKYLDRLTYLENLDNYKTNNITYYILDNNIINKEETKEYSITLYNNVEISFNIQEM